MLGLAIFIVAGLIAGGAVLYDQMLDRQAAATSSTATPTAANNKDKKDAEDKKIIGLKSPHLIPAGINLIPYAATIDFDSTTYADKCLLQLTNASGFTTYLNDFSIRGQPVYRYAGKSGYRWEYKNQADIDANGEQEYKISSNYITSAAQCEDVGDHVRKELEAHDMYTVTLNGVHPYYQIGDKYELNVYYQLPTMTLPTELISVDVEVRGVSIARDFSGIGQTALSLRVPSGAWNKTTAIRAAMLATGLPFDKLNRSNVINIGAYDYPGQADIYCDGVDDDVQIQEAIDTLSAIGGGLIMLMRGAYYISSEITIKNNITLSGEGSNTIIRPVGTFTDPMISMSAGNNIIIKELCIDGTDGDFHGNILEESSTCVNVIVEKIEIGNFTLTTSPYSLAGIVLQGAVISNCYVHDFTNTVSGGNALGIYNAIKVVYCTVKNIVGSGGATGYGLYGCKKCQQNTVSGCSTGNYYNSYADSGTASACADNSNGGFNS